MNRAVQRPAQPNAALIRQIGSLQAQIAKALPRHMDAGRFARIAITALRRDPKLGDDPTSFMQSVLQGAQLGLEPENGLGHAYLVRYGQHGCQLIPGYRGLVDLAHRSGKLKLFYAELVYESDEFVYELGLDPKLVHKPSRAANRGTVTHVYAVAHLCDGGKQFVVLSRAAVEKIRQNSPSKNSPAWKNWWGQMAKAKAAKRLCKWLPLSSEMSRAVSLDDSHDAGVSQTFDVDIDIPAAPTGQVVDVRPEAPQSVALAAQMNGEPVR